MQPHHSGNAPSLNGERAASTAAPSKNLRLATHSEDTAEALFEQARRSETAARDYHRAGLLLEGISGFQLVALADHYTGRQRAFLREAHRHG
jgi:hypothetical protein